MPDVPSVKTPEVTPEVKKTFEGPPLLRPEQKRAPEAPKQKQEYVPETLPVLEEERPHPSHAPPVSQEPEQQKTELRRAIEHVLEEDMEELYFNLPQDVQKVFKGKGEETASSIELLLRRAKVHARKILHLIRAWLKIIPGVNTYFLEKEAKIKTDQILLLKKNKHGDH